MTVAVIKVWGMINDVEWKGLTLLQFGHAEQKAMTDAISELSAVIYLRMFIFQNKVEVTEHWYRENYKGERGSQDMKLWTKPLNL